jgi:hypothetical protein
MAIPRPRMHLRFVQPRIHVYLSRANTKDISGFPGVPRTKSSINKNSSDPVEQGYWRIPKKI